MPRPKKYDWDDKRDICYKLWAEREYSAGQIVDYFASHFNIPHSELPGRNQFHAKFREWGFPARQKRWNAEEEAQMTARLRELYNQNLSAGAIHQALRDEGWDLDDYSFRKFRRKSGLMLRAQNGYQFQTEREKSDPKRKRSADDVEGADEDVEGDPSQEGTTGPSKKQRPDPPPLTPEEIARREQRKVELELQSEQLLQTKKRRRRIRGLGHIPADAPGLAPRYGSETSLDECKAYLQLDNATYVKIRAEYEAICREMGIIKQTQCAEGQWQASKDRLVRDNTHLSSVLHPLQPDLDKRANALNCICYDVTKRMRTASKAMSIADANNLLGLNPAQSKDQRRVMYELLEADHFTTVFACGKDRVDQLRQQWIDQCPELTRAWNSGDKQMIRAVDLLARDARKRYCDDQVRKDPSRKQWQKETHYGPGPGPAHGLVDDGTGQIVKKGKPTTAEASTQKNKFPNSLSVGSTQNSPAKRLVPVGPSWQGQQAPEWRSTTIADMTPPINFDLDPLLLPNHNLINHQTWPTGPSSGPSTRVTAQPDPPPQQTNIPAYFRLAPTSQLVGHHPRMWLGKLASPTIASLHQAATSKAGAARVESVRGLVKNADGSEDSWVIDGEEELGVYLQEAGEKSTFSVVLVGGYA